jgi:hypothetical protein
MNSLWLLFGRIPDWIGFILFKDVYLAYCNSTSPHVAFLFNLGDNADYIIGTALSVNDTPDDYVIGNL